MRGRRAVCAAGCGRRACACSGRVRMGARESVIGHRLRLRSHPGHGRSDPCPQVRLRLGLANRVRVAPAGCAPATAGASSIRLPLRAVSGSPVTRLSSRSAQGWRQRAGGRSGASNGGGRGERGGTSSSSKRKAEGAGWQCGGAVRCALQGAGAVRVRAVVGLGWERGRVLLGTA